MKIIALSIDQDTGKVESLGTFNLNNGDQALFYTVVKMIQIDPATLQIEFTIENDTNFCKPA